MCYLIRWQIIWLPLPLPTIYLHIMSVFESVLHMIATSTTREMHNIMRDPVLNQRNLGSKSHQATPSYLEPALCCGCSRQSPETQRHYTQTHRRTWSGAWPPGGCALADCTTRSMNHLQNLEIIQNTPVYCVYTMHANVKACSRLFFIFLTRVMEANRASKTLIRHAGMHIVLYVLSNERKRTLGDAVADLNGSERVFVCCSPALCSRHSRGSFLLCAPADPSPLSPTAAADLLGSLPSAL